MMLTGRLIWGRGIIVGGFPQKIDDGVIPSYGLDGMLYTFRADMERVIYELQPLQFALFKTLEYVHMPINCGGLLYLKSTYSRQGIVLTTNSPVDPGYAGKLSIGLFNASAECVYLVGAGGFMQMVVHQMSESVEAYSGRHQNGT